MSLFAVILLFFALVFGLLGFFAAEDALKDDRFWDAAVGFCILCGVFIIAAGVWK